MEKCKTCKNRGWETISAVAACNCCEDGEFYIAEDEDVKPNAKPTMVQKK